MNEVDFFSATANKTSDELLEFYSESYYPMSMAFREMIRKYLSRHLMDTDEDHPLKCEITVERDGSIGLSSLEMPVITAMYQDDMGIIWCDEDGCTFELDSYSIDEQMSIIQGFKDYEK